jgi:hypothetical protein
VNSWVDTSVLEKHGRPTSTPSQDVCFKGIYWVVLILLSLQELVIS